MRLGGLLALATILCAAAPLPAQPTGPFAPDTPPRPPDVPKGRKGGQPKGGFFGRATPPVVYYSLLLLRNEAVYKELKLDADQEKKATAVAQSVTARVLSILRDGKNTDEMAREIEKDLAFLKPEQRRRLRELALQRLDAIPAGPRVLAADAGLNAELKLTKDQKGRLAAGAAVAEVLTVDQKKALAALKGRPVDAAVLVPAFPGPGRGPAGGFPAGGFPGGRASLPTTLQYLEAKAVAADLKLTEAQRTRLDALAKKWRDRPPTRFTATEAEVKEARALADALEKEARALLTGDQTKRLAQIVNQVNRGKLRGERDVFTQPAVADALKLTEAQKKQLTGIVAERQKGLLPLFTAPGEAKDALAAVKKYNAETYKRQLAVLTKEQVTALDGLFGKPLEGPVQITAFLPLVVSKGGMGRGPARTPLYLYVSATAYVGSDALHKELGLSADQKAKLKALADRPRTSTARLTEKERAAQAAATEKELAAILKPEQMRRLGEVMLQQYERGQFPFAPASLPRFVEVRKGLQLTPVQLTELQGRRGNLAGVLTEAQKARWKEMLGKPSEAQLVLPGWGGPGRGPAAPRTTPELTFLQNADVQADLKLTAAQKGQLRDILKTYQETLSPLGGGRRSTVAARKAADAATAKVLDASQTKRRQELRLQQAKQPGLIYLLRQPAVVEGLNLTEAQSKRLEEIDNGQLQLTRALNREFNPGGPALGKGGGRVVSEEAIKARAAITAAARRKMEAVLEKGQQEKLAELLGTPFKGTLPRATLGGRGGPPGRGFGD
jgi:hypothetical protein